MRKILLLLLIGSFSVLSGYASTSCNLDGKSTTTQRRDQKDDSAGRPRAPRRSRIFQISSEPGTNILQVISSADVGFVTAVIDNLSSGTVYTYSFNSSTPAFLPISGECGVWRVFLVTSSGMTMIYEFEVY